MKHTSDKGNRDRRAEVAKRNDLCDRCPPHGGENQYRNRKAKPDRYKSKRKGK